MYNRTYGWVQNPSDFSKLKLVVQIFDHNSAHYKNLQKNLVKNYIPFKSIRKNFQNKLNNNIEKFSYTELVGTSKDINGKSPKSRKDAVADGLIQITILPQSLNTNGKHWTDNWSSDGYLRWALSLNFIKHNRKTDECSITPLGKKFSSSENKSYEETKILQHALLCYPPATQVLNILYKNHKPVTKFKIGNQLGFSGEKGFTSYDEKIMLDWFKNGTVEEQKKIKSDIEGTSDKYARMIATWLEKVGFVEKQNTKISTIHGEKVGFQTYNITGRGLHALQRSQGSSKNSRINKYLTWEFLAVAGKNRDYIRSRRSYILKYLQSTTSFEKLIQKLNKIGFQDDPAIIENDITGLNNFGVRIEKNDNYVNLKDNIESFTVPQLNLTKELKDAATEKIKVEFMHKTDLPMKYIELLEIAFDGSRNRDFEIITSDLFKNIYGFNSVRLGGGRKPDGVIYTDSFGIITDTKAYSNGYNKNINQEDEMVRYIEDNQQRDPNRNSIEWWNNFDKKIPSESFYFMWISSRFIGRFDEQLKSTSNRTNTNGAALNVEQLLLGAAAIQRGKLNINQFPDYMNNSEIFWQ